MNGSNALSITDIPFVYSLVNLLFIAATGSVDVERFVIIGLLAGVLGTFLVFWHPIQWIIDRFVLVSESKIKHYEISNSGHRPPKLNINIEKNLLRLSLHTQAIKYQKDKVASMIYFMIILGTLVVVSPSENFKNLVEIPEPVKDYLVYGLLAMTFGVGYIFSKITRNFNNYLRLHALYFLLSNHIIGYRNESNLIKNAIDLNDWTTAKEIIERQIRSHWDPMRNFSV